MTLLYDRVLTEELHPTGPSTWIGSEPFAQYAPRIKDALRGAQVIVADNVCEYFYAGNDQGEWNVNTDFPKVVPPCERFWIEMGRPSRVVSREYGVRSAEGMPNRWGFAFHANRVSVAVAAVRADPDAFVHALTRQRDWIGAELVEAAPALAAKLTQYGSVEAAQSHLSRREWSLLRFAGVFLSPTTVDEIATEAERVGEWALGGTLLVEWDDGRVLVPGLHWAWIIDQQGAIVGEPLMITTGEPPSAVVQEQTLAMNGWSFPALLTISFMNSDKVTRLRHEQETGLPVFSTLEITRIVREAAQEESAP